MGLHPRLSSKELTLLALSLLIISLGLLMFEIALTRVFSVMLAYHYVFIAVSVALLGLGIGAVFFRFIRARMPAKCSFSALCKLSLIFALSIPITTTLVLKIPYTDFLAVYYAITFIPFFFAGMIFALAFDRFTKHSSKLYCASLLGSGIGPLAIIFALESFGGVNAILLVGAISAIGAVAVALGSGKRRLVASSLTCLLLLSAFFATNLGGDYIGEISSESPHKELFSYLNDPELDAKIVRTYWSPYARTDLVELGNYPEVKYIFNDGGAGTDMYRFNGDFSSVEFLKNTSAFFPFYFGDKDNVLIIGPGGGKDVLIALMGGAKNITAVEVNQNIVRIVREEAEYNGGVYYHENVKLIIDEGRSFIRRSADNYDVIFMMLILTKSAREIVGYSLTESNIFTVEAFNDYFEHLNENGRLIVVGHDLDEIHKFFAIAIAALNGRGITTPEATRHIISLAEAAHPPYPVFILKKTPFSTDESMMMHYIAHHQLGFQPIYFPYAYEAGTTFEPLSSGEMSLEEWVETVPYNISPATDDSPFFYNFEKGLPQPLSQLFYNVLFLTSLFMITAWLSLRYFRKYRRKTYKTKTKLKKIGSFNLVLYFLLLGLGFMLIEVALVQKFILFLGQPTLAFSVLLFSLLVGGSIGSFFSDRFKRDLVRRVILVSLFIGAMVTIYAVALPYVFDQFLGYDIAVRSLISAAMLFPLGFLMGIPFPTGLKIFKQFFKRDVGWMWGVNGVASVMGSVLAVVIAILSGFTAALVLGAVMYLCVGLISYRLHTK